MQPKLEQVVTLHFDPDGIGTVVHREIAREDTGHISQIFLRGQTGFDPVEVLNAIYDPSDVDLFEWSGYELTTEATTFVFVSHRKVLQQVLGGSCHHVGIHWTPESD